MARTLAYVTPEMLRWSRETIGFELEAAAEKIGVDAEKLSGAETGDLMLTLRQAEKAASVYQRPLATFFLPEPPEEEPQEAQFRRLPDAPKPPWPPEMLALVRRVRDRQEAAADLLEAIEESPAWPAVVSEMEMVGIAVPEMARHLLDVDFEEQMGWLDPRGYAPLRAWVDAVESLGILVMQNGDMTVGEMRGFASVHAAVPAIIVNTQDDARARVFTIIHELGHARYLGVGWAAWVTAGSLGPLSLLVFFSRLSFGGRTSKETAEWPLRVRDRTAGVPCRSS